jgi:hypothetical protein
MQLSGTMVAVLIVALGFGGVETTSSGNEMTMILIYQEKFTRLQF